MGKYLVVATPALYSVLRVPHEIMTILMKRISHFLALVRYLSWATQVVSLPQNSTTNITTNACPKLNR